MFTPKPFLAIPFTFYKRRIQCSFPRIFVFFGIQWSTQKRLNRHRQSTAYLLNIFNLLIYTEANFFAFLERFILKRYVTRVLLIPVTDIVEVVFKLVYFYTLGNTNAQIIVAIPV